MQTFYSRKELEELTPIQKFTLFPVGTKLLYTFLGRERECEVTGHDEKNKWFILKDKEKPLLAHFKLTGGDVTVVKRVNEPKTKYSETYTKEFLKTLFQRKELHTILPIGTKFKHPVCTQKTLTVKAHEENGKITTENDLGTIRHWEFWSGGIEIIKLPNETSMNNNISDYIKNEELSAEDKLMQKHDLEDPCGTPTTHGLQAMALLLYKENKKKLVDKVKAMEKEEEGEKKKAKKA